MIQEASFTGLLRTVFIIIGILAVLRFIGRFIATKREQDRLNELDRKQKEVEFAQEEAQKRKGEISINSSSDISNDGNTVDIDFEETE